MLREKNNGGRAESDRETDICLSKAKKTPIEKGRKSWVPNVGNIRLVPNNSETMKSVRKKGEIENMIMFTDYWCIMRHGV